MYKFDYHIHTNFSVDSDETMENAIQRSISIGLDEIAFTDHFDFYINNKIIPSAYNFEDYLISFTKYKELYKDKIKLTLGAEIGLAPRLVKEIKELTEKYPFEFIIGSTHDCEGYDLYSMDDFFINKTKTEAYYAYFCEVLENIKLIDDFLVYGHLDYIRRYGGYKENSLRYEEYKDIIDKILKELIYRGKGLEVNTSGYRYDLDQLHPQADILKRYHQLGGEILTIGSDSHSASNIAEDFNIAYEIIKDAGFKRIAIFRERKPKFVEL